MPRDQTSRRSARRRATPRQIEHSLWEDRNLLGALLEQLPAPNFEHMYKKLRPSYSKETMKHRYKQVLEAVEAVCRERRPKPSAIEFVSNDDIDEYARNPEDYEDGISEGTLLDIEQLPKTPPSSSEFSASPLSIRPARAAQESPSVPRQSQSKSRSAHRNKRAGKRPVSAHGNRGQPHRGEPSRSRSSASRPQPNQRSSRPRQESQGVDEESDFSEESYDMIPDEGPSTRKPRRVNSNGVEVRVDVSRRRR